MSATLLLLAATLLLLAATPVMLLGLTAAELLLRPRLLWLCLLRSTLRVSSLRRPRIPLTCLGDLAPG